MTLLEQIKRQVKQFPPETQGEILDFARFLEAQMLTEMWIKKRARGD